MKTITHNGDKIHVFQAGSSDVLPEHLFYDVDLSLYIDDLDLPTNDSSEATNRTKVEIPVQVALIEKGEGENQRKILIGTGSRKDQVENDSLGKALSELSIEKTAITDIILPRGDNNHIGGILKSTTDPEGLNFPNAAIHLSRAEYDAWEDFTLVQHEKWGYNTDASTLFVNHHDALKAFDGKTEIAPGVTVSPSTSERDAQIFIDINLDGGRYLYIGDLFIHPLHIAHPDWQTKVERDPEAITKTRQNIIDMSLENPEVTLITTHLLSPSLNSSLGSITGGETTKWLPRD